MTLEARTCINPDCGFRFTLNPHSQKRIRCPKCGSDTDLTSSVPELRIPDHSDYHGGPTMTVLLDNLRSALNVGAIFRSADAVAAERLILAGITPSPLNPKVAKSSLSAENTVPWVHVENARSAVDELKSNGYQIWALEGGERSENLFYEVNALSAMTADEKIALVLGAEVSGVDPGILSRSDRIFYLPMVGRKESLNVATAFGIAAYLIRYGKMTHESNR